MVLRQQPQPLQLPPVLLPGGHDVDARGVDAAVAQDVRQLGDVLFQIVERPGEELAQIVREHFPGSTFARAQSRFMAAQMLLRSKGRPERVQKMTPPVMPASRA